MVGKIYHFATLALTGKLSRLSHSYQTFREHGLQCDEAGGAPGEAALLEMPYASK